MRARGKLLTDCEKTRVRIFLRILPILGITFIDILGFSIMIALMPFFVTHFGAPAIVVGWTFTAFAVCQFAAGPFWGHLSDRIGRKRVLIASQVGAMISWFMLAFAASLPIVFVARVLEGISGGNLSVTHAYVSDLVEPGERSRAFAYVGAAFSAGMIFGPWLGGTLYARFGYTAPFLAAAALQAVTLLATLFFLPESRPKSDERTPSLWAAILPALHDREISPLLRQRFWYALALYGWFSVFTLVIAAQLHFDAAQTSYVFAGFGCASILFEVFLVGRLVAAFGDLRSAGLGLAVCLASFGCAAFMHTVAAAAGVVVLFSLGLAITDATLPSMLSARAAEDRRGTILAVGSSLENFAGIVMPPLATGIFEWHGSAAVAILCGTLVVFAIMQGARIRPDVSEAVTPAG